MSCNWQHAGAKAAAKRAEAGWSLLDPNDPRNAAMMELMKARQADSSLAVAAEEGLFRIDLLQVRTQQHKMPGPVCEQLPFTSRLPIHFMILDALLMIRFG